MKYYSFSESTDVLVIGPDFPQCQNTFGEASSAVRTLNRLYGRYCGLSLNFDYFVMEPGAKLTDVISTAQLSRPNLLVSARLLNLLDGFGVGDRECFPARMMMHQDGLADGYYVWCPHSDVANMVDFKLTEFYYNGSKIDFGSYQEYAERARKLIFLGYDGLLVLKGASADYPDIFTLDMVSPAVVVSEAVKSVCESAGVTGASFLEFDLAFSDEV